MREPARLRVVRPGFFTTVQDLGRAGFRRFGMPVGGAMDAVALRLANRLVGNPDEAAALEITIQGPVLAFETDTVIAMTGADLSPTLDGRPVPNWTTVAVGRGGMLAFGERRSGARAYLGLAGGINVPPVLGSRSTHCRSRTGGIDGRALIKGDELRGEPPWPGVTERLGRSVGREALPPYSPAPTLRAVLGPQAESFLPDAIETLTSCRYTLSPQADRMGYRLVGPSLAHAGPADIVSDATPPGSLQVPANRQPILLMADGQTTGGYPKIAVVISADLPLAAQLAPGDSVGIRLVGVAEAQALVRAQRARLAVALPPVGV